MSKLLIAAECKGVHPKNNFIIELCVFTNIKDIYNQAPGPILRI